MLADLAFAWKACRAVKSNAILLSADRASVGIGMGQVNRVDAARLAVQRAGDRAAGVGRGQRRLLPVPGCTGGADRGPECGPSCEPGGSIRDRLSIEAAQAAGMTMYLTGVRHFYH